LIIFCLIVANAHLVLPETDAKRISTTVWLTNVKTILHALTWFKRMSAVVYLDTRVRIIFKFYFKFKFESTCFYLIFNIILRLRWLLSNKNTVLFQRLQSVSQRSQVRRSHYALRLRMSTRVFGRQLHSKQRWLPKPHVSGVTRLYYYYFHYNYYNYYYYCKVLFDTIIIVLRFYFLIIRMVVCAWMASTTIRANVLENIPASSATFLRVSHSCTRRLRPVNITNAKMEYVINQTVLRMTTYVNVLRGTQVLVHACSVLFVNCTAHYSTSFYLQANGANIWPA